MSDMILMLLMMINTMIFMLLKHPITCGTSLLIQTIMTSIMMNKMNNSWYAYILFLIMIGGMLILFTYMTSIASNEKFKFNKKLFLIIISLTCMMSYLIPEKFVLNMNQFTFSLIKYYDQPYFIFMIIIYLLITLIMVVKMTNLKYGPLRQNF